MSPLDKFARILAQEIGYATLPENRGRIDRVMRERAAATTGGDVDAYLSRVSKEDERARAEWQEVLRELTIGESFFFRDAPQFRLLRETLLPRLVERRADRRTLRVWSAGCSTGEEPYSIAILLRELLSGEPGWRISIVGTDVNESSLERARRATYSPWSLRGLPSDERERYFVPEGNEHRLRPEYRDMVSFARSNLVKDRIPDFPGGLHDMDLILCRNVFIYFDAETTRRVAEKLAHALAPGGFLLTGHADLQGQGPQSLRTHVLPGSLVLERPPFELPARAARPPPAPAPAPPAPRASPPPAPSPALPARDEPVLATARLAEAEAAFRRADYDDALAAVEAHLAARPEDEDALRMAAVASANLGQHGRAARYCRRLLEIRPRDIEARYLLAKLAQDRGDEEEARSVLLRLLAEAPAFVPAYLDLAWLERRRGDVARAERLRDEARRLLERLPRKTILSAYEGLTAEDLLSQIQPSSDRSEGDGDGRGEGGA